MSALEILVIIIINDSERGLVVALSSSLKQKWTTIASSVIIVIIIKDKTMSQPLWSFLTSCRTSVSEFQPPFLCQAILIKAYKVREFT